MTRVAALVPVLHRPHRAAPVTESFHASTGDHDAHLFFICTPTDAAYQQAVVAAGERPHIVQWDGGPGDWAKKINWGFRRAHKLGYEWMLLGADDLVFHPGWIDAIVDVHATTNCCVIGTNDLGNPEVMRGRTATHPAVHRDYLECGTVDGDGLIVDEGYDHNFVDTEFIETAKWRGTFAAATDAHVEHLHPFWKKGEDDPVYAQGRARMSVDRARYQRRRRMFT